jgi:uncharacterized protein
VSEASVEAVRRVYAAFGAGDVPTVLDLLGDVEWHEAEGLKFGGVYRGAQQVAENVFGPIAEDVSGFAVTPEEYIADGDTVAVVVRYSGTGNETGQELDLPAAHVWDVPGGKVARFRQFVDTVKFNEVVPKG